MKAFFDDAIYGSNYSLVEVMREDKLKDYFDNTVSASQLATDVQNSQVQTSKGVISVYINRTESKGQFEITKRHLIKLCNDVIEGELLLIDLNTIAFAIITSEYFYWDENSADSEIIENVIYDWDNYDIGFDLSLENVKLWKEYLLTGDYKLDFDKLRSKFRNERKTKM